MSGGHVEWKCEEGWENCELCNYDSHPELFICKVCNAAEGQLPTQCPGFRLSEKVLDLIYSGKMDFANGGFIVNTDQITIFDIIK